MFITSLIKIDNAEKNPSSKFSLISAIKEIYFLEEFETYKIMIY